jgi:hypothetical protein
MKSPRISTRSLMIIVLAFGLFLGLGLPAAEVYRSPERHVHAFLARSDRGAYWVNVDENVSGPFWPRLARRLSGKPWEYQRLCEGTRGRLEEICEEQDSGYFFRTCFGNTIVEPTEAMERRMASLNAVKSVAK